MTKENNRILIKITESVLLIASIAVTLLPLFFCIAILSDTIRFDRQQHPWRTLGITLAAAVVLFGFLAQWFRLAGIWTGKASKVVFAGLIMGLCAYLFFMVPVLPDLMHVDAGKLIVYSVPLVAILFSLRNMCVQRRGAGKPLNIDR